MSWIRGYTDWYRLESWKAPNLLVMKSTYPSGWKKFSFKESVVGVTYDNREANFLLMGDQPDFKIFLEREPDNPVDPNAIKVMGSATVDGEQMTGQLGYLSKETAQILQDEEEIDVRPESVYLPYEDRKYDIPLPDPIEAIIYHMESRGLSRRDLEPYLGSRSRVSEILNRKRPLSIEMIRKLHAGLGIPAVVLIQPYHCMKAA